MKTACVLLLAISYAALGRGTAYGARSDSGSQPPSSVTHANTVSVHPRDDAHAPAADGKRQTHEKPSNKQPDHRLASDKGKLGNSSGVTNPNRPKQSAIEGKRSAGGNSANLRQPDRTRSGDAAKEALMLNKTVSNAVPVRQPSVAPHTRPAPNNQRHRDPNPAVIGGPMTAKAGNTGTINGTRMNRRP